MTPCDVRGDIARRKTSRRANNIQYILHVSFGQRSRVGRKTKREGAFCSFPRATSRATVSRCVWRDSKSERKRERDSRYWKDDDPTGRPH